MNRKEKSCPVRKEKQDKVRVERMQGMAVQVNKRKWT